MSQVIAIVTHPIFGVVAGALITWVVARFYYVAASKELLAEARKLHKLSVITLRALEAGGVSKLARDSAGDIVGLAHQASGNLVAGSAMVSGAGTVEAASPDEPKL